MSHNAIARLHAQGYNVVYGYDADSGYFAKVYRAGELVAAVGGCGTVNECLRRVELAAETSAHIESLVPPEPEEGLNGG